MGVLNRLPFLVGVTIKGTANLVHTISTEVIYTHNSVISVRAAGRCLDEVLAVRAFSLLQKRRKILLNIACMQLIIVCDF